MRRATRAELPSLARVLARAFSDDPVTSWLLPDERTRELRSQGLFRAALETHVRDDSVYTTPDRRGAAIWAPPGRWRPGPRDLWPGLRWGLPAIRGRLVDGMRFLRAVERVHPQEPHWYLAVLGTEPEHQGQGLGSAVMAPVLQRCDDECLPAYLESSKERNIPFYRRHGFEVTEEIRIPGAPVLWAMWREPRTP